jgi:hypothetical protein
LFRSNAVRVRQHFALLRCESRRRLLTLSLLWLDLCACVNDTLLNYEICLSFFRNGPVTDLAAFLRLFRATQQHRIMFFVSNPPFCSSIETKTFMAIIAEAMLDGNLYSSVSTSASQPRIGGQACTSCQSGTWPDLDGQRLVAIL